MRVDPKIRSIVESDKIVNDVANIGKSENLRIDKIGILTKLVAYSILNLLPLSDFVQNVEEELELDRQKALSIANKVNTFVFQKIREEIKKSELENRRDIDDEFITQDFSSAPKEPPAVKESASEFLQEKQGFQKNDSSSPKEPEDILSSKLSSPKSSDLEKKPIQDPYLEPID